MKVDIYRREEAQDRHSYLLVPQGQEIPQEAANVDWKQVQSGVDVDATALHLHPYEIDRPREQLDEKGYAITSVYHQVEAGKGP
jgi:hypothetical protein